MPDNGQNGQCEFIKPDGQRCRGRARAGSPWCPFHDPAVEERRRRGQSRGGRTSTGRRPALPSSAPDFELTTPADVRHCLAVMTNAVLRGRLDARLANAATYSLSTLLKSIEGDELARRIERLEQAARHQLNGHHRRVPA
jgi:hypothetical protein